MRSSCASTFIRESTATPDSLALGATGGCRTSSNTLATPRMRSAAVSCDKPSGSALAATAMEPTNDTADMATSTVPRSVGPRPVLSTLRTTAVEASIASGVVSNRAPLAWTTLSNALSNSGFDCLSALDSAMVAAMAEEAASMTKGSPDAAVNSSILVKSWSLGTTAFLLMRACESADDTEPSVSMASARTTMSPAEPKMAFRKFGDCDQGLIWVHEWTTRSWESLKLKSPALMSSAPFRQEKRCCNGKSSSTQSRLPNKKGVVVAWPVRGYTTHCPSTGGESTTNSPESKANADRPPSPDHGAPGAADSTMRRRYRPGAAGKGGETNRLAKWPSPSESSVALGNGNVALSCAGLSASSGPRSHHACQGGAAHAPDDGTNALKLAGRCGLICSEGWYISTTGGSCPVSVGSSSSSTNARLLFASVRATTSSRR
mmetsp:Transcript_52563/g.159781  ORF Transcript_52563/g.159781 Transcript_52563/m.159781 type:complete len:433 (+) Transcript_52563:2830-4128(+)